MDKKVFFCFFYYGFYWLFRGLLCCFLILVILGSPLLVASAIFRESPGFGEWGQEGGVSLGSPIPECMRGRGDCIYQWCSFLLVNVAGDVPSGVERISWKNLLSIVDIVARDPEDRDGTYCIRSSLSITSLHSRFFYIDFL